MSGHHFDFTASVHVPPPSTKSFSLCLWCSFGCCCQTLSQNIASVSLVHQPATFLCLFGSAYASNVRPPHDFGLTWKVWRVEVAFWWCFLPQGCVRTPLRFHRKCACATSKYQIVLSLSLVLLWLLVPNIEPKHCFGLSSPPTCNISECVWYCLCIKH